MVWWVYVFGRTKIRAGKKNKEQKNGLIYPVVYFTVDWLCDPGV